MGFDEAAATDPSTEPFKLLWELKVGEFGDLLSPPVIAGDRLFLTNVRGTVFAVFRDGKFARGGKIAWKTHLPRCESIAPTPLLDEKSKLVGIAVVSRENVYVLSSDDGRTLYRLRTGDQIFARPAGDADTLIVGSRDGHIYRVAWRRGESLWKHNATDEITDLVWTDGLVVFTTDDGRLAALDGSSGRESWSRGFPRNSIKRIESSESGTLWVETSQGGLSSVAVASGETLSTFIADPGFKVSQTYVHGDRFYYAAQDGHLGAIDPQGVLRWRTKEPVGQVTGWAFGKDSLIVSTREGSVVLLPLKPAEDRTPSEP